MNPEYHGGFNGAQYPMYSPSPSLAFPTPTFTLQSQANVGDLNNHSVPQMGHQSVPINPVANGYYVYSGSNLQHQLHHKSMSEISMNSDELHIDTSMSTNATTEDGDSTINDDEESSYTSSPSPQMMNMSSMLMPFNRDLSLDIRLRYGANKPYPVKYHKNMARTFPQTKERTPEEQLKRAKNTAAARESRAKAKFLEQQMEENARAASYENARFKQMIACQRVYGNILLEQLGLAPIDWAKSYEQHKQMEMQAAMLSVNSKK